MGIMAKQQGEPHLRHGQKALANAMTELVHGAEALESAQRITHALFKGNLSDLDSADIAQLKQDGMPYKKLSQSSCTLLQGLVEAEIAPSNNEGRKLIKGNAIALNGDKTTDFEHSLDASNTLHGVHVIKKGKTHWFMLELGK